MSRGQPRIAFLRGRRSELEPGRRSRDVQLQSDSSARSSLNIHSMRNAAGVPAMQMPLHPFGTFVVFKDDRSTMGPRGSLLSVDICAWIDEGSPGVQTPSAMVKRDTGETGRAGTKTYRSVVQAC